MIFLFFATLFGALTALAAVTLSVLFEGSSAGVCEPRGDGRCVSTKLDGAMQLGCADEPEVSGRRAYVPARSEKSAA